MSEEKKKIAEDMMREIGEKLNGRGRKDWGKTINMIFTDIDVGYAIKFAMDGSVEVEKKPVEDAAITINAMVEILKDVMDGNISGLEMFNGTLFEVEGDLMSLGMIMPAFEP